MGAIYHIKVVKEEPRRSSRGEAVEEEE